MVRETRYWLTRWILGGVVLGIFAQVPRAESIRFPLPELAGNYEPGLEPRTVDFDLGVNFGSIEDVIIELEMEHYVGPGCTHHLNGDCWESTLANVRLWEFGETVSQGFGVGSTIHADTQALRLLPPAYNEVSSLPLAPLATESFDLMRLASC